MSYGTATRRRPNTGAPTDGSRTITIRDDQPREEGAASGDEAGPSQPAPGVLRLRGGPPRRQRVVWSEEVVDNEHLGRKSSKICCIYHKPKSFDESSDESSSDESDGGNAPRARRRPHHHHDHDPDHPHAHDHDHPHAEPNGTTGQATMTNGDAVTVLEELEDPREPNAYEAQPKSHKGKGKGKV